MMRANSDGFITSIFIIAVIISSNKWWGKRLDCMIGSTAACAIIEREYQPQKQEGT